MKEFIDEYIRMKEKLKSYEEKEKIDKIELKREAYKKLINTGRYGIYDKSRRYEELMEYIKEIYRTERNKKIKQCLKDIMAYDESVEYYCMGNCYEEE